jgi:acetyl esterase/lipase
MLMNASACFATLAFALTVSASAFAQPEQPPTKEDPVLTRLKDVVYGRRDGLALTMDVFTPKKNPNGLGVIIFVSAEFRSGQELLARFHPITTMPFLNRGYTVFQVMHGSQPKYTVPEIVDDAHRAVRFIKYHAKEYGIDAAKIGVAGASSGGYLSLMMGCAGGPGDPKAADPVDRESSRAAAVACFFPPSDFLTLDKTFPKKSKELAAPFDFHEWDSKTGLFERVSAKRRLEIGAAISPINHAAKGAAPTLIVHGDKDDVVPISQSEAMIDKLKENGVECKLLVKKGKPHFHDGVWVVLELPTLADWFDQYLLSKKPAEKAVPKQPSAILDTRLSTRRIGDEVVWDERK